MKKKTRKRAGKAMPEVLQAVFGDPPKKGTTAGGRNYHTVRVSRGRAVEERSLRRGYDAEFPLCVSDHW